MINAPPSLMEILIFEMMSKIKISNIQRYNKNLL